MTKFVRWSLYILISLILLFIVGTLLVNYTIKNKVENFITTRLPDNIAQSYKSMSLSTIQGTIQFDSVSVSIKNKSDDKIHTRVSLEKLIIEDVSYWDYLFNKEIHIEDIKIKKPIITYYKDLLLKNTDTLNKAPIALYKPVLIDELSIDNTTFTIIDKTRDSTFFYTENLTIEIDDILINQETLLNRLPVRFSNYEAEADSLFVKVSPYENLTVSDFKLKNKEAVFLNMHLKTKYSRTALSRMLPKERDHFDVTFERFTANSIDFGFKNRKLFVKTPNIILQQPDAVIFRDKLVADDLTIKPLYSKMLRDLTFDLTVDKLRIDTGSITYTEKVKSDNTGGTINFHNMNTTIENASNTYKSPTKTKIVIDAIFMKKTPVQVHWDFDVNDTSDQFLFSAEIDGMQADELNKFTQPNLKVMLEGRTNKTYFTISGDNNASQIDMRMNYDDFKIEILNKEGKKGNKILSAIANIFIKKDSDKEEDNFREGSGTATRDKNKSFFNYLWLNTKEGLIKTLTGDGDK